MTEDQIVTKLTAELALQAGFRGASFHTKDDETGLLYYGPTQAAVQRWLREEHNKCFSAIPARNKRGKFNYIFYSDFPRNRNDMFSKVYDSVFDTWEEAMESAIRVALRMIKK